MSEFFENGKPTQNFTKTLPKLTAAAQVANAIPAKEEQIPKPANPDKLGALWEKTDKNGNVFYSGNCGDQQILVFQNNYRQEERHPVLIIMKAKERGF